MTGIFHSKTTLIRLFVYCDKNLLSFLPSFDNIDTFSIHLSFDSVRLRIYLQVMAADYSHYIFGLNILSRGISHIPVG